MIGGRALLIAFYVSQRGAYSADAIRTVTLDGMQARRLLVLFSGAVLALAGCGAFDATDLGPHDLDEDQARSAVSSLGVEIPDGLTFVAGVGYPPGFVGSTSYYMRFDAHSSAAAVVAALNEKGGLGKAHNIDCTSPLLASPSLQKIGLQCAGVERVSVTRNDNMPAGERVSMGAEAIAVVDYGSTAQLYVIAEGT